MAESPGPTTPLGQPGTEASADELDLTDATREPSLLGRLTPDGVWVYVSHSVRQIVGFHVFELEGQSLLHFVHPDDVTRVRRLLNETMQSRAHRMILYRHRTRGDEWIWLESVAFARRSPRSMEDATIFVSSRDVTARMRLEQDLTETREAFRLAVQHLAAGVGATDVDQRWTTVNPALVRITGYSEAELLARGLRDLVDPEDLERHDRYVDMVRRGDEGNVGVEERIGMKGGSSVWVTLIVGAVRDADNQPVRLVAQLSDIGRFKRRERDLEHQARHDPLTGVANRRLLDEAVRRALAGQRAGGGHAMLAVLDLDDFKGVNDRFGHAAGDAVLIAVARRLEATVRDGDIVARIGGDEFVVLFPGLLDEAEATALASRLREPFRSPVRVDGEVVSVSASIGTAFAGRLETVDSLLRRADIEMFRAK